MVIGLLQLRRVEDHLRVGDELAWQIQGGRDILLVGIGYVLQLLAAFYLVGSSQIETLDAEIAVLVLKGGVGIVEARVNDTDDDTLARIGLGQLLASTVERLLGLGNLTGDIGLVGTAAGHIDEQHALDGGCCLELGQRETDNEHIAKHGVDLRIEFLEGVGDGGGTLGRIAGNHKACAPGVVGSARSGRILRRIYQHVDIR